jgi:hypothetical protein
MKINYIPLLANEWTHIQLGLPRYGTIGIKRITQVLRRPHLTARTNYCLRARRLWQ